MDGRSGGDGLDGEGDGGCLGEGCEEAPVAETEIGVGVCVNIEVKRRQITDDGSMPQTRCGMR